MLRLTTFLLLSLLLMPEPAAAAPPAPLGEVVVVVTAEGRAMVGLGEPPREGRVPALVFFPQGEAVAVDLADEAGVAEVVARATSARVALADLPTLRRYAARGVPANRVAALDARLAAAGLALETVDAPAEGADPTAQMTADFQGFHRRDQPGSPAEDAKDAMLRLVLATRFGLGHGEPAFTTNAEGQPWMLWPEGFKEPTTGYACPFPSSPALAPPPGMVLEVYLQAGQDGLPQEAMAQFCDRSARALLKACGGDDLLVQFEPGPAEVRWAAPPPGEALWWIVPDRILLPGGSEMGGGDSCLVEALAGWEIASPFHERVMRVRLVEDDLQTGCAREVDEKCQ